MVNTNSHIEEISDLLALRPVNEPEIEKLLIQGNEALYHSSHLQNLSTNNKYQNSCSVLTSSTNIPKQFRAYHSGPSSQSELINGELPWIDGLTTTDHIYFSIDLGEIVRDYLLPENRNDNLVYVTDLRNVKGARVQTSYSGETLWNDKIRTLIDCINDDDFMKTILSCPFYSSYKYVEPFKNKSKDDIKTEAVKEIKGWISKYTIPFKLKNLERYRKKGQTYILIPQPMEVTHHFNKK